MGRERYADRYDLVGSLRAIDRQVPNSSGSPQFVFVFVVCTYSFCLA